MSATVHETLSALLQAADAGPGLALTPKTVWAILGALIVGLSLGLLGSGGAILTIPILVYLVGHDEKAAIVESLVIVGTIALVSAVRDALRRSVDWPSVLLLAIPGMVGSAAGAWLSHWFAGRLQLALLAILMLVAALFMVRRRDAQVRALQPWPVGVAQGFGLGVATGLVGIGGGFLIVPVLVLLRNLPMPVAVGTSLALIAFNCAAGLAQHAVTRSEPLGRADWTIVAIFAGLGMLGASIGGALGSRIDQRLLRRIFAATLVVVAGYVVVRVAWG